MIKLDTVCDLSANFNAKSKKDREGVPATIGKITFTDLQIDRDVIAALIDMPLDWVLKSFYDDQGAPTRRFFLGVRDRRWRVSGGLNGPKPGQALVLLQADLEKVELDLIPNGALMCGRLTWAARGDEVEEIAPILGTAVRALWEITDSAQPDMFDPQTGAAARATAAVNQILGNLGHQPPG
jgi:hypothetical protein